MPLLDPNEMGMPNKLEIAERLYKLPMYQHFLSQFYGDDVWNNCHQLQNNSSHKEETSSNCYHNLGVPSYPKMIKVNQFPPNFITLRLFKN
ncbi:hypothetical protein A6B39_00425 [Mannheimia granulomatis]|uniref:hypothetical protein n=1 Tax=Mannheimia granulomatis TaxID=85402 RepID=UPI00159D1601|nr:hypothetical protein [Mannheimia granulomatis]QLB14021.1 hypothetical protein A6B39_00425 [Mannheimia granulomatis]